MPEPVPKCDVCGKTARDGVNIQYCGRCKTRAFCGRSCQRVDWPSHKPSCSSKPSQRWYDEHRKCTDGSFHFGELELITWEGVAPRGGGRLGWGNCLVSDSPELKRKYEEDFGCDDSKLFAEWPRAYRWTCCGTGGDTAYGCDHHGTGPLPCECDYCHMGKSITERSVNEFQVERRGLKLSRGPDKRSYSPMKAEMAEMGQGVANMFRGLMKGV